MTLMQQRKVIARHYDMPIKLVTEKAVQDEIDNLKRRIKRDCLYDNQLILAIRLGVI